ncbi:hypothetical protein BHM03_00041759 [Ensete ventricosum]|nr:hypothetical protein BHM03_00041759 [Ensete ventricosum]
MVRERRRRTGEDRAWAIARGVIVDATTNSRIEPLLMASYAHSLSHADVELRSFQSCLKWMCIDQSNTRHRMVSLSLFFLLGIFVPTAFHFVLSCAPTCHAYDIVV